jgi:hypothetical protein
MNLNDLNPYALQIKIGLICLTIIFLGWVGWHEKGIRDDLANQKKATEAAKAATKMYADAWNNNQQLQKEITDAVKQIRVESNTYIDRVETAAPPVVPDGGSIVFIAPGVPVSNTGLSGFAGYSAGRTGATATPGGSIQDWRLLPD